MNPWITPFKDKAPAIHPKAFVDISVRIIGDVEVGEGATIWPMAVLRADAHEIRVGAHSAILDLALLEAPEGHPVRLGEYALVSHGAMVHGARIEPRALVGIGAIVLDGAFISSGSIIGSGALVPPGTKVPPNSLVLGVPGKVVRETTPQERQGIVDQLEELSAKAAHLKPR